MRTPASRVLIALVVALGCLIAPSVANAHAITAQAECVLVGNQPTVRLAVTFVGFHPNARPTIRGTVWLGGDAASERTWTDAAPALTWDAQRDATLVTTWNTESGTAYTANASFSWDEATGNKRRTASAQTGVCPEAPAPAVSLVKTGADRAAAGDTVTYAFAATNVGNVTLEDVRLTDANCQDTLTRTPGETDSSFDPADVWTYTCTAVVPAGVTEVVNVAEVCGSHTRDGGPPVEVCDSDTHAFPVAVDVTAPAGTPPASTPPASPRAGVLPERIRSARARLRGRSGCVRGTFRARVTGRGIRAVAFYLDGRLVKRDSTAKRRYTLRVRPARIEVGRHRLVARVRFRAGTGAAARRLPLTFRRCARQQVAPQFTG